MHLGDLPPDLHRLVGSRLSARDAASLASASPNLRGSLSGPLAAAKTARRVAQSWVLHRGRGRLEAFLKSAKAALAAVSRAARHPEHVPREAKFRGFEVLFAPRGEFVNFSVLHDDDEVIDGYFDLDPDDDEGRVFLRGLHERALPPDLLPGFLRVLDAKMWGYHRGSNFDSADASTPARRRYRTGLRR